MLVEEITDHGAKVRYPFNPQMIRPGGTLSGPTIMGLADAGMYAAILGSIGKEEMAVTSQMNIHFLHPPAPTDLIAIAEIVKRGRRSVILEVKLYSKDHPEVVALVTGTYALPQRKGS